MVEMAQNFFENIGEIVLKIICLFVISRDYR